jgi:hypothetical protein
MLTHGSHSSAEENRHIETFVDQPTTGLSPKPVIRSTSGRPAGHLETARKGTCQADGAGVASTLSTLDDLDLADRFAMRLPRRSERRRRLFPVRTWLASAGICQGSESKLGGL